MSKYKIILVILGIVIAILGTFLLVMFTGFLYILPSILTNYYCASLGVEHISDHELNIIQNYNVSEPIQFVEVTSEDLRDVPKLEQVINMVANRVEYNTNGLVTLRPEEVQAYHEFLSERFEEQRGSKLEQKPFVMIYYNNDTYVIDGFVFTTTPYDIQLSASLHSTNPTPNSITMTAQDFESVPKIKTAIDEIGTYETSPFSAVGLPEDEWYKIQKWLKQKYEQQYGTKEDGSYSTYLRHDGKNYFTAFSIC